MRNVYGMTVVLDFLEKRIGIGETYAMDTSHFRGNAYTGDCELWTYWKLRFCGPDSSALF